jgi:hypothetical protein
MYAIIVDFSKAFDLVPHGRLLVKIAKSGVDTRVVVWIREFLTGRTQRGRVRGELSDEVRVGGTSRQRVRSTSVLSLRKSIESHIRLFADDCVICRKILTTEDTIKLQRDVDRQGERAVENEMKINPNKRKAVCFTRARVKDPLKYSLLGTLVLEASSCKYLGIILRSDLSWANHVTTRLKRLGKLYTL